MSWDKIENHLFDKYCVEGEDKELCNLMAEHDAEIIANAIDEFAERLEELFKYESAWGKTEYHQRLVIDISEIYRIAEEMRGTT